MGASSSRRSATAVLAWLLRGSVAVGLGAWMGCDADAFQCRDHADCDYDGEAGVCQLSGYCSFSDETCDSGQRYGEFAGRSLGNACVGSEGDDAGTDGPPDPGDPSTPPSQPNRPGDMGCWLEDFDGAALDPIWCVDRPPGIELSEHGGVLNVDLVPERWEGGEQLGGIRSCDPRPLLGMTVTTRIVQVPAVAKFTEAYIELRGEVHGAGIGVADGEIYAFEFEDGDYKSHREREYDPDEHRLWRVRGTEEGFVTETSADGEDWKHLHTHDIDLSEMNGIVFLGAWSEKEPTSLDRARYDWLEVCAGGS